MTDGTERDADEQAIFAAIPDPIELAPDVRAVWDAMSDHEEVRWSKAAVLQLESAFDKLLAAIIATTSITAAVNKGDREANYTAFTKLGVNLVESQNAVRRVMTLLVADRAGNPSASAQEGHHG